VKYLTPGTPSRWGEDEEEEEENPARKIPAAGLIFVAVQVEKHLYFDKKRAHY
jgi:hypothetical protein